MTTERDFDRIAAAWMADGPEELSDRVIDAAVDQIHLTRQRRAARLPRRLPSMTNPARIAALVAVGVLILTGFAVIGGGGRSGPTPTQAPAPSVAAAVVPSTSAASAIPVPPLTKVITSPRNGYSVSVPADWTITPSTARWTTGIDTLYADPGLDKIGNAEVRLAIASEPLGTRTTEAWLAPFCRSGATGTDCGRSVAIGNATGHVDEDGLSAQGGTVASGGVIFDAAVSADGRGYIFILDGHVDDALFEAILKTVEFDGPSAIDLPALSGRFTSPTNGFSIATAAAWTTTPATKAWTGLDDSPPAADRIAVTGTDTTVNGASQALPKGTTFEAWLARVRQGALDGLPNGCDGGDPATWPDIAVGPETGHLQALCNAQSAYLLVGGRIYEFDWTNDSFTTDSHLGLASWKELLKSVVFSPGSARP